MTNVLKRNRQHLSLEDRPEGGRNRLKEKEAKVDQKTSWRLKTYSEQHPPMGNLLWPFSCYSNPLVLLLLFTLRREYGGGGERVISYSLHPFSFQFFFWPFTPREWERLKHTSLCRTSQYLRRKGHLFIVATPPGEKVTAGRPPERVVHSWTMKWEGGEPETSKRAKKRRWRK